MEEQKKNKVVSESERKLKFIREEVNEINKKKQDLGKCVKTLDEDIAKDSTKAEKKTYLVLLTKANSFRRTKIEKENIIEALDNALQKLDKDFKSLSK